MKIVTTATLTCQSHGLTTKRPLIVCPSHGSKDVLKCSKYHLTKLSLSQHALVENNISFKHWGKHIECQGYQYQQWYIPGGILFLLFCCVALIPLNKLLNNTRYSYKIYDKTINHPFHMDDLKLFGKNDQ